MVGVYCSGTEQSLVVKTLGGRSNEWSLLWSRGGVFLSKGGSLCRVLGGTTGNRPILETEVTV